MPDGAPPPDIRSLPISEILSSFGRVKKEKPQSQVVRGEGNTGTIELKGVAGIYRRKNGDLVQKPSDLTGVSLGQRPKRPDGIIRGEES